MENQPLTRNDDFQLLDTIALYLKHWQWFALSIVLCCILAFLYIQTTPKVYQRVAALQINEDSKPDIADVFGQHGQFKTTVNVNNEIEALKSPQLAQEVVKRLNLHINYMTKKGMKPVDLYMQSPVIVLFPDTVEQPPLSFQLKLLPDSMVQLSNFVLEDSKIFQTIRAKLNEKTSTPVGDVVICPSQHYSDELQQPIDISKTPIKSSARSFSSSLKISLSNKQNTVIVLDMEDVSIQRAEDFLNNLISVYKENCLTEKSQTILTALNFLNEKIVVAKRELDEIDTRVAQFKSRQLVTDPYDAASFERRVQSDISGRAQEVQTQKSIAEFILKELKDKNQELLPVNIGLNHQAIESNIIQHNELIQRRNRMITDSGESNPVLVDLNNSINSLRQSILQSIDNLVKTNDMQLQNLQKQVGTLTTKIASNPGQVRELQSLEREQNNKNALYMSLVQQREENEIALVTTTTNSRLISLPSGSSVPVKPQKIQILLVMFVVGIGVPGSIIWGRDMINTAVRGKIDLSDFPVPSLGTIPLVKITNPERLILVESQGRGAINEAFRIVRTNLDLTCKPDLKVIMFTSMEPGCGKTFVSANIAKSFALAEKRIVLLDLDLRMASLSKFIDSPATGITDVLSKSKTKKDLFIVEGNNYPGFEELFIIPVGAKPPNPSELLMSNQLKTLIEDLKISYDYVFIDCPPVDLVTDAVIVAQLADLSVFILRENHTDRRKLPELTNILNSGKFKNMRVILNGSSEQQPSGKYHAYYDKISSDNSKQEQPKLIDNVFKRAGFLLGSGTKNSNDDSSPSIFEEIDKSKEVGKEN